MREISYKDSRKSRIKPSKINLYHSPNHKFVNKPKGYKQTVVQISNPKEPINVRNGEVNSCGRDLSSS